MLGNVPRQREVAAEEVKAAFAIAVTGFYYF